MEHEVLTKFINKQFTNQSRIADMYRLYKILFSQSTSGRQSPKMMLYTHPSFQGRKEGTSKKLVIYTYRIVKQILSYK